MKLSFNFEWFNVDHVDENMAVWNQPEDTNSVGPVLALRCVMVAVSLMSSPSCRSLESI